jgi:hypothetical protein
MYEPKVRRVTSVEEPELCYHGRQGREIVIAVISQMGAMAACAREGMLSFDLSNVNR